MDYVSIRVSTLRGDQKIDFDAYVKINDKMVLYVRRGDSFEGQRLRRLKDKKLKKMFIESSHEGQYRDYLQRNIEMAYDSKSNKDIGTRAEIIHGQQQSNVEEIFENPDSAESYLSAKDAADKYVQFLISNSQAVQSIMAIQNSDKSISHHGVSVATLGVALAQKLAVTDSKMIQLLTMGAFLHDFGHHESSVYPGKKKSEMNKDELTVYQSHPELGARNVQDKKHFDQLVIRIINEHEECADGSGFPRGLTEREMDPLSLIVSTCNAIDRLITFDGIPKEIACKQLMIDGVGKYPLSHLQKTIEIVKSL
jgi:HD-GYP domain-containing protein (c-di-GMP phosphodiesterase class II)